MNDKIKLPKTYEEAEARKKEVLELINNYNEELFSGKTPTLSDDEIDILQEEYQILDDIVIDKVEIPEEGVVEEEIYLNNEIIKKTKEYKKSIFDEINPFIFLYGIIIILFSSWFMIEAMGNLFFKVFSGDTQEYSFTGFQFAYYFFHTKDFYQATDFSIWIVFFLFYISFPLILLGIDFIVRLFFKENKATKKAFWWIIGIHFVYIVVNFIILYFNKLQLYYESIRDFLNSIT